MVIANKIKTVRVIAFSILAGLVVFSAQYFYNYKPRISGSFQNAETSPNYKDANFDLVRRGMTQEDLLRILGEPLLVIKMGGADKTLVYSSRLNLQLEYSAREVWLHNGKVKQWHVNLVPVGQTP